MNVKTSICIPAYNEEFAIGALLNYLSKKSSDLVGEILVCTNNCTDRTEEIVKEKSNKDDRIKLLNSDFGKPNAFNKLCEEATSDYIVFFDADVSPINSCIEELVDGLISDEKKILVGGVGLTSDKKSSLEQFIGSLDLPLAQDFLSGRVYAFKKSKLLKKFREKGFKEMPTNLFYDDFWLQTLFTKDEFRVVEKAIVYYNAGNFKEYLKGQARLRLGREEIKENYPQLYSHWLNEFRCSGNDFLLFIEKINNVSGFSKKSSAIFRTLVKFSINLLYQSQILSKYKKLREEYAASGGAFVLANSARVKSVKGETG